MENKIIKSAFLAIQISLLVAPFILVGYHIYNFTNNGDVNLMPLSVIFSDFLNISITKDEVAPAFKEINNFYTSLVRLPLLLWLFVLSIPAFIGIYRKL